MAKVLKGCNCCISTNRRVRLMTEGARIEWCHHCKARTVWEPLASEEAAEYTRKREQKEAFMQSLIEGAR